MDILQTAQESISFPSCGKQPEGTKRSNPTWTMPKATRESDQKLFVSSKHTADVKGRDSPGFAYCPQRIKELPKWGFGTSEARPLLNGRPYPDTSNDLIGRTPDALKFKYKLRKPLIGTCPRTAPSNAPDFTGYKPGTISPGPQRYTTSSCPPCIRLGHAPSIDQVAPKWTMRPYTDPRMLQASTGKKVGPGSYPSPGACETQASSVKPTKPQWKINQRDRFEEEKHHDRYRVWDGHGEKRIQFNRCYNSSPSFSFGTSTRNHVKKLARADTKLDRGPAADMPPPHKDTPAMPHRREIIKYGDNLSF